MANELICLNNIIGLTKKDCDCIDNSMVTDPVDQYPADWYKLSTSGYYIDRLEGIVSIDAMKDVVNCQEFAEFVKDIIDDSIRDTAKDISASINERYKKKETNFVGFIGTRTANKTLNLDGNYAGMKLNIVERTGAVIVIKGIGLFLDTTSVFNVLVYRRYTETDIIELVDTIEGVNSTANAYTSNLLEEPLLLPMEIENEGEIEYLFLYEMNGMQPRNNDAHCGQCGRKERDLKKLIYSYGGVKGDDIDEMGGWSTSDYNHGIVLDAEIRCNAEAIICTMFNASPEWSSYVAQAVLYKSAWKIHKAILSSNNITNEIMTNRETVEANMEEFDSEYLTRITYLSQNVDLSLNGCYVCGNDNMKRSQILL